MGLRPGGRALRGLAEHPPVWVDFAGNWTTLERMDILEIILQAIAGLGILNVWLIRFSKATPYRGGNAANMTEEFAHYGLPKTGVYVIGFLKIASALGLLAGIAFPVLVLPSACVLSALMLGALAMHLKVKDPAKKSVPAGMMLGLSLVIAFLAA